MVGAEGPEPRVMDWSKDEEVAEATTAGENLTMVEVSRGTNERVIERILG